MKKFGAFLLFPVELVRDFWYTYDRDKATLLYPFVPSLSGSPMLCQISCPNGADKSRKNFYGDVSHGFF